MKMPRLRKEENKKEDDTKKKIIKCLRHHTWIAVSKLSLITRDLWNRDD